MKTAVELMGYGVVGALKIDSSPWNIALFSLSEILSEILEEVDEFDEAG